MPHKKSSEDFEILENLMTLTKLALAILAGTL
jgi:hypothetical protein